MESPSVKCQKRTILITGGIGYIGSHTVIELYKFIVANPDWSDCQILVIDNFCNSSPKIVDRMNAILSNEFRDTPKDSFFEVRKLDMRELQTLDDLFYEKEKAGAPIWGVIHFAGWKSVRESVMEPLAYYENNFFSSFNLLKCMAKYKTNKLIFSSTACVYGNNGDAKEDDNTDPLNPYGATKSCIEYMLRDVTNAHSDWSVISLRYFNPAGAHESGLIGDAPPKFPNNLFPYIEAVVVGQRTHLSIFGTDYDTKDGTGVRDYIHIVDLAKGHIAALKKLASDSTKKGYTIYNLGTGVGCSVKDIVAAYSRAIGKEVPHKFEARREGDVAILLANVSKANKELEWKAEKTLEEMCKDSYRWITMNPDGIH